MSSALSNEEKKELARARQSAVRHAWKEEQARVKEGLGTRDWTTAQQKEILERGSVKGYDGHHMKSVSEYPEYAGDPKNIQFLTETEHFEGAHQGSYHNLTNGYYDPETQTMNEFEGDELRSVPVNELSDKYAHNEFDELSSVRDEYVEDAQSSSVSQGDNIDSARADYSQNETSEQDTGASKSASETTSESNGIGR